MTEIPKIDPIKYLLVRKFGNRGIGLRTVGEPDTNPELAGQIAEYRAYLEGLADYHLSKFFREEEARALYDEQHLHRPSAQADFEYWARMPHWTLDEAVALSLGKAPEQVSWRKLAELVDCSSIAAEYSRRRDLAVRYVACRQLDDPLLPATFITWADQVGFSVPVELRNALDARGIKDTDWKTLYEGLAAALADKDAIFQALQAMKVNLEAAQAESRAAKALSTKERDSMLAIIAAMAVRKYRYNPNALKNAATQNIADDVQEVRLRLDVDTVRKYVAEAGRFLKANAEPED
jgi:hypothetical protein